MDGNRNIYHFFARHKEVGFLCDLVKIATLWTINNILMRAGSELFQLQYIDQPLGVAGMLFFHPAKIHTHTETEVNGGVFKRYVVFFWGGVEIGTEPQFHGCFGWLRDEVIIPSVFFAEDATAMRRDEGVFSSSDKNGRSEVRALHVVRLFGDNLRCQALLELYHLQQT